ncbi:MAG: protein translocase subunit SecD [Pseudomonadota bacterium]
MTGNLRWKALLIAAITIVALVYLSASISDQLPGWWLKKKIKLGLDLQGGTHLLLEVETSKAVENAVERASGDLKDSLLKKGIRYSKLERIDGNKILVEFQNPEYMDKFKGVLDSEFFNLKELSTKNYNEKLSIILGFSDKEIEHIEKLAIDQSLETIRNRIDQFGVSEPIIQRQGEKNILVQLPGIKDINRAKNLIGKTALLEFKIVDEDYSVEDALRGKIPSGDEVLYQRVVNRETGRAVKRPYLLKEKTLMTGDVITNAKVRIDSQFQTPYVTMEFDNRGRRLFDRITAANVHKRLAIVLDKNVYSAPVIQERISGGSAQITGSFTADEAHDLAIVLRAGSLPAPVKYIEERTVGPSLGRDSIHSGIVSIIIGGLIVIFFMIFYYRLSGLVANIALVLNIILIMAAMAAFQATLTLPGIAGIVLTIGMAVDANILILERIREELLLSKTPRSAIDAGYGKAFRTILDSNLTTLITAALLFQFGTGPVKGFAVTLTIGIVASFFTAIFVTRFIYDLVLTKRRVGALSI